MIKREQLPAAKLPEEVVEVASLGGSVIVRGLRMSEALAAADTMARGPEGICELLARAVVLEDGAPLYTADEWDSFGGQHREDCLELLGVAMRLSGLNAKDNEKKAPTLP